VDKDRILILDDEQEICEVIQIVLEDKNYDVETMTKGELAFEKLKERFYNLLIIDLNLKTCDGMNVLKKIKKINPYIEVIVVTGYPTIELAVEAVKNGAFDFICKPFNVHQMSERVTACLEKQKNNLNYVKMDEITALLELSKIIEDAPQIDHCLNRVLDVALQLTKAKRGSIMVVDKKNQELVIRAARGLNDETIKNSRIPLLQTIDMNDVKEKSKLLVFDSGAYLADNQADSSYISVLLRSSSTLVKDNIWGIINVTEKINSELFNIRDETVLRILAKQAAIALENADLYTQRQEDITKLNETLMQLRITQDELIQTKKMAAIGHLASGIAHEIRNPLGIILGGVECLEINLPKKNALADKTISLIKESVNRANSIILQLLNFSRASELKMTVINLRPVIKEAIALVGNKAHLCNIDIKFIFPETEVKVNADSTLLRQVFFNLSVNAIDAMPKGGTLSISVLPDTVVEGNCRYIIIEVTDTGRGMSEEVASKAFNPFFTMKSGGKGTGLGLSIVHLILKRHNGAISIKSKIGHGTTFTIKLPQHSA